MSRAFTPGLRIVSAATIHRIRELPVSGDILVSVGENVDATQIVARAELPGELFILRLAERMGIEPFEVMNGLKVKEGDAVTSGQELCVHAGLFGLFRTQFKSPETGVIEFVGRTHRSRWLTATCQAD